MGKEGGEKGVFDEIAELGKQYDLTTYRVMGVIEGKTSGEKITRGSIMEELIGEDYAEMTDDKRNLIFNTLIFPDLDTAVEHGSLKKISDDDTEFEKI